MKCLRILIVDDHPLMREGLKAILEIEQFIVVVGEASNGLEAVELTERHEPDLILMDIDMPGKSGIEISTEIKEKNSKQKILLLTMHDNSQFVLEALKIGIEGYVLKMRKSDIILKAIFEIASGENFYDAAITETLTKGEDKDLKKLKLKKLKENYNLTRREIEIITFLIKGKTTPEMAEIFHISPNTVSNHRRHIISKLNLKNAADLVRFAVQHGITIED